MELLLRKLEQGPFIFPNSSWGRTAARTRVWTQDRQDSPCTFPHVYVAVGDIPRFKRECVRSWKVLNIAAFVIQSSLPHPFRNSFSSLFSLRIFFGSGCVFILEKSCDIWAFTVGQFPHKLGRLVALSEVNANESVQASLIFYLLQIFFFSFISPYLAYLGLEVATNAGTNRLSASVTHMLSHK